MKHFIGRAAFVTGGSRGVGRGGSFTLWNFTAN
jgi:hypothetical protein